MKVKFSSDGKTLYFQEMLDTGFKFSSNSMDSAHIDLLTLTFLKISYPKIKFEVYDDSQNTPL